jgi:3-isopropylmalate/(R)-2-methylmalate dehydratase small subunit
MKNRIEGLVCRLGHDTSPTRISPEHQAGETLHLEATPKLKQGNIIVAGRNFGCGPRSGETINRLKELEIPCVIAASFARGFYRDAINGGLPAIECPVAFEAVSAGEQIAVDFDRSEITLKKGVVPFPAYPDVISRILASGGLMAYARKAIGK